MPSSGGQTCALDRKSTRLNSSHTIISYAVFYLKKTHPPPPPTPPTPHPNHTTRQDTQPSLALTLPPFSCTLVPPLLLFFFFFFFFFFFKDGETPNFSSFPLPAPSR